MSIDSNDAAIAVNQLSYHITGTPILSNIKLSVEKGAILGVVGPNGSGKTTLLKLLSGQLKSNGCIQCEGESFEQMSTTERAKKIAVVNQLNESVYGLSLTRIVSMGRLPHQSLLARESVKDKLKVEQALLHVGLFDKGDHAYSSLSGGEQQRALIAQALVQAAPILILDEPINHLDVYYQYQILHLLRQLSNEQGITVVMSLHDLNLAARFCDSLALLNNGKLTAFGEPQQVLTPQHLESVFRLPCKIILINTEGAQPKRIRVEFMPDFAAMGIQ